jgi:hypothetical protein
MLVSNCAKVAVERASMVVQTEAATTSEAGIGAEFGPPKPGRLTTERERLLGAAMPLVDDEDQDGDNLFARDQTTAYRDEGIGSTAGSLPSLNTDVTER